MRSSAPRPPRALVGLTLAAALVFAVVCAADHLARHVVGEPPTVSPAVTDLPEEEPAEPTPDGWRSRTGFRPPGPPGLRPAHFEELTAPPEGPRLDPPPGVQLPKPVSPRPAARQPMPIDPGPGPIVVVTPPQPGIAQAQPDAVLPKPRPVAEPEPKKGPPVTEAPEPAPGEKRSTEQEILLGAARTAVRRGDLSAASARFEEYLARFPADAPIRAEYAGILIQLGRTRPATRQLEQLVNERPNDASARVALADVYVYARSYRRAVQQLERARELAPDNLEVIARLARAYTFDEEVQAATRLYEEHLAAVRPNDPQAPPTIGLLLVDLERPAEAVPYLQARVERDRTDLEALANLVRAYARMGDRQRAQEALAAMAEVRPSRVDTRNQVADALYQAEELEFAGLMYAQVLARDPNNQVALVGTARVAVRQFQPAAARKVLDGFRPDETSQRIYYLTVAEYYQLVGEYSEAKQIYLDFLRRDESDHEARLALGAMYGRLGFLEFLREYEKGKAEFAKIPPERSVGRRARLGFAETLVAQRRFGEAIELLKAMLAETPSFADAAAVLTRTLAQVGEFDKAEAVARGWLAANPRNEGGALSVRLALGRVLLDGRRYMDAAREYETVLSRPAGRLPVTYYGLARANAHVGHADRAHESLAALSSLLAADARTRLLLADQFSADYDDGTVVQLTQEVLKFDPQNLAALIRLADAQQRIAKQTGDVREAVETCQQILALSPTNARGNLALARCYAIAQDFRASVSQYELLIAIDADFLIPRRERARVLYAANQFGAAAAAYQEAQFPSADDRLVADLTGLARRDARMRPLIEPYLVAKLPGSLLRSEVAKLAQANAEPEVQASVQRVLIDYDARSADNTYLQLESDAKQLKGFRNYEAVPAYQQLIAAEPGNTEARFDLGQVYGALKFNGRELEEYGNLLAVDPTHRDGAVAAERSGLEVSPQLRVGTWWFDQAGRDGLASINRQRETVHAIFPFGDEVDYVGVGYSRVQNTPTDDTSLDGNIAHLLFSKRYDERGVAYGQLNFEQYEDRITDRPTFDVGTYYFLTSTVRATAGGFLENVVENGESMRQDIFRGGFFVGGDVQHTRYWNFGGSYRFAGYSDDNAASFFRAFNACNVCLPPKQLRLVTTLDYWTFQNQSILGPGAPQDLRGTVHPYFAPANFTYVEQRVEWYHWLSRDYFVHSNQLWYSLQYGLGYDNQFNAYNNFRVMLNWDVRSWVTLTADGSAQVSDVYNVGSVMAWLVLRCPCCCR